MRSLQYTVLFIINLVLITVCHAEETVHLQLRWHHQFQFAGYYAAIQQGYYQKAGLNVVLHEGSPDYVPIKQVLKGEAHYGVANSELILARLKGEPLILLAAIYQHSPSVLLARKEAKIYNPSDLIGKKVMTIGDYVDADFVAMFNNERLNMNKIHNIPSSYNIQDLITGHVDAFNSYISNEPFLLDQLKIPYTILYPRNYGVDFYSDMLFTSEQELKEHPERVKAFLNASLQGWHYALSHPDDIINLLLTQYQIPKTKAHLEFEAKAIHDLVLPDLVEIGHINPWRLQHIANTFVQAKLIKNTDLLNDFVYQPDAVKEHLKHYLKIAISITIVLSLIVVVFYWVYRKMKRENYQREQTEKTLRQRTEELALHNHILQLINQGETLPKILNELTRQIEYLHPKMICSVLLLDDENKLRFGAAPSLPDFYNQQVDGTSIGDGVGSCGTAAFRAERCVVEDIQQHPYWQAFKDLAKQAGVASCWSQPITDNHGNVLGTFGIYHAEPRTPKTSEIELIENYASLTQLVIEQSRANTALLESEQRLNRCQLYGGIGTWEADLINNTQIWSSAVTKILGFPELKQPTWNDFLSVIHPDDRQNVIDNTNAHIQEGKKYDITYRIINNNKQIRWMRSIGRMEQSNTDEKPRYFRGTVQDVTELKEAEAQIKQLAFYDPLTKLPNRRLLSDRLHSAIQSNKKFAVLVMDLDHFKAVNDTLGHAQGDELLKLAAKRILGQLTEHDTVARLGGDEFVVLLPNTHQEKTQDTALNIIQTLIHPFNLKDTTINIGTSIGISYYPQHGDTPEQLLDKADSALYQAKAQGRGCFCIA